MYSRVLTTELKRLRGIEVQSKEEVAEFDAGLQAARAGDPPDEPEGLQWDHWMIGYAWQKWPEGRAPALTSREVQDD